ncbi:polyketide synthase [Aspergillus japonicus CBS 114.51]|uniref:Polyketide synthase n=1 Tax=Aspergillus japonicus CBS 114.51 TaxID=1448312 RepID=A0A8T8WYG7_ASPJA|nr:polyketide synthase [Aspergillus japonicus CBS 114.51]RAH80851.1 polyketide synthase [Aspergillus japonicus CBS 114.51]
MTDPAAHFTTIPIAVVGMGCRFAGGATDPEALWRVLEERRSTWSPIPSSRFELDGVYHPNGERLGTTHVRGGHFLDEDPAFFDAAFFNVSGEVASCTDPQHRLILEVVYEALEAAGIPIESVAGSNVAVFAGTMSHDYQDSFYRSPEALPRYLVTGNAGTMVANRVSHFYDLRGPSVTIDTACSTTLTALHIAVQSLRAGEAKMAIVTGANLMLNSNIFTTMSTLGFLSPDGVSYSLDSRANGYGRGEGVAAVVLKPLFRALQDNDPIRLVIRETALNQDGRTPAISAPSAKAQEQLIRECYRQTSYIEAHGTGTPAGDPLELQAILAAFDGQPMYIGSVKASFGHTEATSGLASLIKMAMALERTTIPPNASFLQPDEASIGSTNLQIPFFRQPWTLVDGSRRASINNFGFGGANAHLIVERYEPSEEMSPTPANGFSQLCELCDSHVEGDHPGRIYVLSAKDERSCQRMMSRLSDYLTNSKPTDERQFLANLAHTLASHRSSFRWKAACVARNLASLASKLSNEGTRPRKSAEKVRLGWVFTGQGAQWFAMGRELINSYPVFRQTLLECDEYIKEIGANWSILDELNRAEAESRVNEARISLPLSTSIQIALVRLLWSWNICPVAITSHSSGEAAAAYAAGAISARSAIGINYTRGIRLAESQAVSSSQGGMLAAALSRKEIGDYIDRVRQEEECLVVACVNSPCSVTISGDLAAISRLEESLNADDIFTRRVKVTHAFHSCHIHAMADALPDSLAAIIEADVRNTIKPCHGVIYTSPRTGTRFADISHLRDPTHWVLGMKYCVEFESAFRAMCIDEELQRQEIDKIIEVGPHGALGGPIQQNLQQIPELAALDISYVSCLARGKSAVNTMQLLAVDLFQADYNVDLKEVNFPRGSEAATLQVLVELPTYPWNHQTRYWKEPRNSRAARRRTSPVSDLIGFQEPLSPPFARSWQHILRVSEVPWLRDHVIGSHIVFPGAGFITMAIDGLSQLCQPDTNSDVSFVLHNVDLAQTLILPADGDEGVDLRLTLRATDQKSLGNRDWQEFSIHSIVGAKDEWVEHCTGLIRIEANDTSRDLSSRQSTKLPPWSRRTAPRDLWSSLHATGICHGPLFRNIARIESDGQGESWSTVTVADTASAMPHAYESQHVVHPTTLDSAIQAAYTVLPFAGTRMETAMLPRRVGRVKIPGRLAGLKAGDQLCVQAMMLDQSPCAFEADVAVFTESNSPLDAVIELKGLTFQAGICDRKRNLAQQDSIRSSWHWAPDITLISPAWLEKALNVETRPEEVEIMLELRRCTVHFIQEAICDLLMEDAALLSGNLSRFYAWMQAQLVCATNGELGQDSTEWLRDNKAARLSLRSRVAANSTNGEMVCHLGPKLPKILRGEADSLELMMEGHLLSRYYGESIKWSRSNAHASELVRLCCHKNPRARILELGGGTGACTGHVVDALGPTKPVGRYDFTDASAAFFEAARMRFSGWEDVMDFRRLDIETNPAAQGFDCGSYDVVLACQVLHATSNMRRTLDHVRQLIKPGGKLVLVETTRDQLDEFFTFGLLPGWWLGEEPERQSGPSLTPEMWRSVLDATGFNGVEFEARDCDSEEFYMISTMMSTAVPVSCSDKQTEILVVHLDPPPSMDWAHELQVALGERNTSLSSLKELDGGSEVDGKMCVFIGEVEHSMLECVTEDGFKLLTSMLQMSRGTLWVTRGAAMDSENPWKALHLGLLRTLRNENPGSRLVSLDLDPRSEPWTAESCNAIANVLSASLLGSSQEKEFDYAERDGVVFVPRMFSDPTPTDKKDSVVMERFQDEKQLFRLDVQTPGLLDSLHFRMDLADAVGTNEPSNDWVEIQPKAFGLNFRDILVAMGQLESDRVMGFECAGIVTKLSKETPITAQRCLAVGDRVCALMKGQWTSKVRTARTNVVRIPETLSFGQAASIPLAFTTAYISLYTVARLRRGERVLIHSGAGGVGQAAIILARLVGAEVFATAGTQAKRDFLIDKFELSPDHVFSSRDSSFLAGVQSCSGGKGVNLVLNSLSGPLLQSSFDCLADFGRFVEIGKKDLEQNSWLSMATFARNVSFSSIDILYWQESRSAEVSRALTEVMRLLEQKTIDLVDPISEYPISAVEKAFRTMQSGQHVGKIVVTTTGADMVPVHWCDMPFVLKPDASYLVAGGMGGIGSRICEWMVERGARHLLILSRNARTQPFVTGLQQRGCTVRVDVCDIADEGRLQAVLRHFQEDGMPPIRGVIQAAMVLKDALVSQMTADDFHTALRPKVQGSWNLHNIAPDVDFFVMLSSLAGVIGGVGLANYAAAGAFQDALAQHRTAHGKHAVTIDLGMVKSIGYVAEADPAVAGRLTKMGYQAMHEAEVLAVLEQALQTSSMSPALFSHVFTSPAVIVTGINTSPGPHWTDADWMQEARFAGIRYREPVRGHQYGASSTVPVNEDSLRNQVSRATTQEEATALVVQAIGQKLVAMFGLAEAEMPANRTLAGVGFDSLVAIELRNWITAQLNVDISVFDLMKGRTIAEVAEVVMKRCMGARQQ